MRAFFTRAWHIIAGAGLTVLGVAGSPLGAGVFGPKWAAILVAAGQLLQAAGIVHADGQKPAS